MKKRLLYDLHSTLLLTRFWYLLTRPNTIPYSTHFAITYDDMVVFFLQRSNRKKGFHHLHLSLYIYISFFHVMWIFKWVKRNFLIVCILGTRTLNARRSFSSFLRDDLSEKRIELKQFQYCSPTFQTHHTHHPAIIRILIQRLEEEDLVDLADIIRPTIQILPPWRLMLVIQAVILAWMSLIQAVSLITAVVMTKILVSCRHLPSRSARLYNTIIPIFINPYPEDQPLWPQVEPKAQIPVLCWPAALWIWMEKAGHSPNHNLAVSLLILSAAGLEHHPKKGLPDVKKWFWKKPKKVGWLISTISSIWIPP